MKNKKYWEDVEYKDAIKEYSEWNQRCLTLNEFNPNDSWAFTKRDECVKRLADIKSKDIRT